MQLTRRRFMAAGTVALTAMAALPGCITGSGAKDDRLPRRLSLVRKETGEEADVVYRVGREYDIEALARIDYLLRDLRANEMMSIDVALIELLHDLQDVIGRHDEITVLSGYRTPKTNAALRRRTSRAAKNSLHMKGMAIDLRMPGTKGRELRSAALTLNRGGVGFYSRSDFIHLDTGPPRTW